jgi:hypothetical protein
MSNVLLFYETVMVNILPKMVIHDKLLREKYVNNSKSSSQNWYDLNRNM